MYVAPRKPKKRKVKIPCAGVEPPLEAIAPFTICQAARSSPLACWPKTSNPSNDDKFLFAASIGMRKLISFPLRDSIFG